MKNNILRIFLGGDVFGPVGLRCVETMLPSFLAREEVDFCVINGENASAGVGLSAEDANTIRAAGADAITGGNHSFEKRDYWPVLETSDGVLRPLNFPDNSDVPGATDDERLPGRGLATFDCRIGRIAVLNLQGREGMSAIDCPFRAARAAVAAWNAEDQPPVILIDFHAESSQEKEALGLMLDGTVAAVVGTHTHVQTADERVLPGGTAYMTDLGMIGPARSVIGSDPAVSIKRNITQVLYRMEIPEVPGSLRGLLVDVDASTRRAVAVTRVELFE